MIDIYKLILLVLVVILFSCANEMTPKGGIAPQNSFVVEGSYPSNGDTFVSLNQKIVLKFSDYIDKRTIDNNFVFYPFFDRYISYKLKGGKSIEVEVDTILRKDFVHFITVKNGLKNIYGQPLSKNFTLVFSTGNKIFKNSIKGRVFDKNFNPEKGVNLYLFKELPKNINDMFLLKNIKYGFCSTNENGEFEFINLQKGRYFVIGLQDKNGNNIVDENEKVAVLSDFIELNDTLISNQNMYTSVQSGVLGINSLSFMYKGYFTLNLPIKNLDINIIEKLLSFQDLDSLNMFKIDVDTVIYFNSSYYVYTNSFGDTKKRLRALIDTTLNLDSNYVLDTNRLFFDFVYSAFNDTIAPKISVKNRDDLITKYNNFELMASKPIFKLDSKKILVEVVNDSVVDSVSFYKRVDFNYNVSSNQFNLYLKNLNLQKYGDKIVNVKIYPGAVYDYFDNSNIDTLILSRKIAKSEMCGAINFFVDDSIQNLILLLYPKKDGHFEKINVGRVNNSFMVDNIVDGVYSIFAFDDKDGNRKLSDVDIYKKSFFGEKILVGSDSLRVRAGWTTSDTLR